MFRNTQEAGLVFDFNGWAKVYNEHTFTDIFTSFGYPGLHQLGHLFFYSCYKIFGFNGTAWYLLFSLLHASTAVIAFSLVQDIGKYLFSSPVHKYLPLLASFLFLTSPFAVDVAVSKVCLHYLLSTLLIFISLRCFIQYLSQAKQIFLLGSLLSFSLALFCLEIAYILPALVIYLLCYHTYQIKVVNMGKVLKITLLFFGVLASFLLLHKVLVGAFIGHYGSEVHTKFVLRDLLINFSYYLNNYLFFFDFWSYSYKEFQTEWMYRYGLLLFTCLLLLPLIAFVLKRKMRNRIGQLVLFAGLFFLALLPILNLYCVTLQPIEADRYAYLASIFIYAAIAISFLSVSRWVQIPLALVYMFFHFSFTFQNIEAFSEMGQVSRGLLDDFKWEDKEKVIILVQPENNNGARAFTTISKHGSEFAESLYLERGIDIRDKVDLIYEMNINSVNDSVVVEVIDKKNIKVKVGSWGSWFWKHHLGAQSFKTKNYSTIVHDGLAFDLILNEPLKENEVMLYMNGNSWQVVNF
ncbi:hypothetical protein N9D46_01570 [Chitinophagales bacterium]|nr:hypothetical protein [Chitinophagales bacterium]